MATIEIDGKTFEVENGKMIIEVADEAGIYIPRFCYHKKLSVAANCRMCLVEVENNRKTLPACATPITNGMKVFTKSKEALRSQQAVMEFLLINHPLDCPICDQGGECDLQDLSMGFGHGDSRYNEAKRAVNDDDLGPLIATEMTRCIHCTRCVRFGEEIAGIREIGSTGRGENVEIGTYIKHSIRSEVSGNIIDLCPVGALTSKPYRFTARSWEMTQYDSVAPHDCLGSNIHLHTLSGVIKRAVPRECESINEVWLSDRDRFSYLGLNSPARATTPWIKRNGQWESVDWPVALQFAAEGIAKLIKQYGPEQFAAFSSASSTLEEMYLLQKMLRQLGVNNLDHRLQQVDFCDENGQPNTPVSSLAYADLDKQASIVLVGCNIDREVPLAGTRVRKAFVNGAKVYAINPVDYPYHFDVEKKIIINTQAIPKELATLVVALVKDTTKLSPPMQALVKDLIPNKVTKTLAASLSKPNAVLVTGALCENHPQAGLIRTLIALIASISGASILRLTTGANTAGAWLSGMVPHRSAAGKDVETPGLSVQSALDAKLKGYFLLSAEPEFDFSNPHRTRQCMLAGEFVVVMSAFKNDSMMDYADVILPIAPFGETSGTYINVDNTWQTVKGATKPIGEARPAWKILRVLANLLHCDEFEFTSTDDVLDEINRLVANEPQKQYQPVYPDALPTIGQELTRIGEWPLYRCDSIVRHADELQHCGAAEPACIRINPLTAAELKLDTIASVSQSDIEITLPVVRDERIAEGMVWVPSAMPETVDLGHAFAPITIK